MSTANALAKAFFEQAQYSVTAAVQLFYDSWDVVFELYPKIQRLKTHVRSTAETNPELARAFFGNAPLIARSILT